MSIKALEIAEEKQAVAQYGSSDSGASLGDIFKAAIKQKEGADDEKDDEERRARLIRGWPQQLGAAGRHPAALSILAKAARALLLSACANLA